MKASIKSDEYPKYFNTGSKLLAFISPTEMYKIEPIGSNKNPGVTIDHYNTRKMVIKHYPSSYIAEYTRAEFKSTLTRLYDVFFDKILK